MFCIFEYRQEINLKLDLNMTDLQNEFIMNMTIKDQIKTLRYKHSTASIMGMNEEVREYLVGREVRANGVITRADFVYMIEIEKMVNKRIEMIKKNEHLDCRLNQNWLNELHELNFKLENKGA